MRRARRGVDGEAGRCETVDVLPGRTSRPVVRMIQVLAVLGVVALATGCVTQASRLTASEQASFGTRTFAAPFAVTFAAAREALPRLGYTLGFVDPVRGRITTLRRQAGGQVSIGIDGRSATPLWLQYDLTIVAVGVTRTRVVATPHKYAGARDISRERAWALDGAQGLHSQWRALFKEIEAGL